MKAEIVQGITLKSTRKIEISTSVAFLIWAFLLSGAFVYTGIKPDAQFSTYAFFLTLGLGAYTGKRLFQKHPKFNCK